ncbi:MAG: YIP1 family protein [Xanthomonadales bacterium]|nr:YIP1 family protein [Xanthomonadales bacterium]
MPDPNPWKTIWLKPRYTIRWLLDNDPERHVLLLGGAAGIAGSIDRAIVQGTGDHLSWPGIVMISVFIGPIFGILGLLIGSWLLRVTGGWLGGTAKTREVVTAYAWSGVPTIVSTLLVIPAVAVLGQELFNSQMPSVQAGGTAMLTWYAFLAGDILLMLWGMAVFLLALSEVQGFSVGKAFWSAFLAVLIVMLPFFVLGWYVAASLGPQMGL